MGAGCGTVTVRVVEEQEIRTGNQLEKVVKVMEDLAEEDIPEAQERAHQAEKGDAKALKPPIGRPGHCVWRKSSGNKEGIGGWAKHGSHLVRGRTNECEQEAIPSCAEAGQSLCAKTLYSVARVQKRDP